MDTTKCNALFEIATTYEELKRDKTLAIKYYNAYLKATKEDNAYHRKLTAYALARKKKFKEELLHKGEKPAEIPVHK